MTGQLVVLRRLNGREVRARHRLNGMPARILGPLPPSQEQAQHQADLAMVQYHLAGILRHFDSAQHRDLRDAEARGFLYRVPGEPGPFCLCGERLNSRRGGTPKTCRKSQSSTVTSNVTAPKVPARFLTPDAPLKEVIKAE